MLNYQKDTQFPSGRLRNPSLAHDFGTSTASTSVRPRWGRSRAWKRCFVGTALAVSTGWAPAGIMGKFTQEKPWFHWHKNEEFTWFKQQKTNNEELMINITIWILLGGHGWGYIYTYMYTYNGIYNRPYDLIAETMHLKKGKLLSNFWQVYSTHNYTKPTSLWGSNGISPEISQTIWYVVVQKKDLHRQCVTMFMKKWWSTSDIEVNITKHIRMLEHVWGLTS